MLNLYWTFSTYFTWDNFSLYVLLFLMILIPKIFLARPKSFISNFSESCSFRPLLFSMFDHAINISSTYRKRMIGLTLCVPTIWHELIKSHGQLFRCLLQAIQTFLESTHHGFLSCNHSHLVAPCTTPLPNPHVKKLFSHPSALCTDSPLLLGSTLSWWSSSWLQERRSLCGSFLPSIGTPSQQVLPCSACYHRVSPSACKPTCCAMLSCHLVALPNSISNLTWVTPSYHPWHTPTPS